MTQKKLIKNTAALNLSARTPLQTNTIAGKYKMGLQLFSVHQDMTKNVITTLKAAKAMGYEDFETFGFDSEKGTYYGYKAKEFKKILEDLQISANSGHYEFASYFTKSDDELKRFVEQCINGAKLLDMKYIVWPWIFPEQRTLDNFKLMSEKLNIIGEQVTASGIGFAYHNHGFEFMDQGGENGFDVILRETDPSLVKLQLDMYWVMNSSKQTPKELISKQPGRYVMWHLKDMNKLTRDCTELGNGIIDYLKILPNPVESGLKFYYLEQEGNYTHNPIQSAAESAKYFKKNLKDFF